MRRLLAGAVAAQLLKRHNSSATRSDSAAGSSGSEGLLARAAEARREIAALWTGRSATHEERAASARALVDKYSILPETPRESDVAKALGESFDRLMLMLVPLGKKEDFTANAAYVEKLLGVAGKNGINISVKTVQHLFARSATYSEAIALFYAMRKGKVAMGMDGYYAMIFSLQRLEEESWGLRFREQLLSSSSKAPASQSRSQTLTEGSVGAKEEEEEEERGKKRLVLSEQALDFIMNGCENQLMPENKPWVGRVMFADTELGPKRMSDQDFDAFGEAWVRRYKNGHPLE